MKTRKSSIRTSLISLRDALNQGMTLSKDMNVVIPIVGEATLYGFIADDDDILSRCIDRPPSGMATILSNRAIYCNNQALYRFMIFNSVCKVDSEKYNICWLYVPRLFHLRDGQNVDAYKMCMLNEKVCKRVGCIDGVTIEDDIAYYHPKSNDLFFQSSSKLRGIGNDFAVITRRLSKITDCFVYEIFGSEEVMIERDAKVSVLFS